MKNKVLKYYIAVFYLCSTFVMFSQGPGANDTGGTLESTDPPAPIDDYVWILALLGLVFVFIRLSAIQSKKTQG